MLDSILRGLIALSGAALLLYYLLVRFGTRVRVAPPLMAVFRRTGASERVAGYLARGQTLQTMQAYHTKQHVSLRNAKYAIEQMRLAVTLVEAREYIAAIQAYRTEKQVSLREAKAAIDF